MVALGYQVSPLFIPNRASNQTVLRFAYMDYMDCTMQAQAQQARHSHEVVRLGPGCVEG
jgi:hypothetical protein